MNSTIEKAKSTLPSNFGGLREISQTVDEIAVARELGCQCGSESGVVRAAFEGDESPYLDPVSFECVKCGNAVTFFDSNRDGYDGRLNDGACYEQGDKPQAVSCKECGGSISKLTCRLLYNADFEDEGDVELLAEAQDYFDFIEIKVSCADCGAKQHVGDWELA